MFSQYRFQVFILLHFLFLFFLLHESPPLYKNSKSTLGKLVYEEFAAKLILIRTHICVKLRLMWLNPKTMRERVLFFFGDLDRKVLVAILFKNRYILITRFTT